MKAAEPGWALKSEILVIKGEGKYEITEIGGRRKCEISFNDQGRMLFDGQDIETEDFMAYVGLLDIVNDALTDVVLLLDGDVLAARPLPVDAATFTEDDAASANADAGKDDHGEPYWEQWRSDRPQDIVLLRPGSEYLVRTQDGMQRYPREHRMSFLGANAHGDYMFNARPFAGTQTFRKTSIKATMELGDSAGRDDPKRYMNKIIRDEA